MILAYRAEGPVGLVRFSGRFLAQDVPSARQKLREIIDRGNTRLILDLSELELMDSAALAVLISAYKAASIRDGTVVLLRPTPMVRRLIELTRLGEVFEVFEEERDAVARLS